MPARSEPSPQQHQLLGHRRMYRHALIELRFRHARFHSNGHDLKDLRSVGTDHVGADNLVVRFIYDDFRRTPR